MALMGSASIGASAGGASEELTNSILSSGSRVDLRLGDRAGRVQAPLVQDLLVRAAVDQLLDRALHGLAVVAAVLRQHDAVGHRVVGRAARLELAVGLLDRVVDDRGVGQLALRALGGEGEVA